VSPLLQDGGQIAQAEVALILVADQSDLGRYVILKRRIEP